MKTRRINWVGLGITWMILTFSLILIPSVEAEKIKLKASTWVPVKHALTTDCFGLWTEEIKKRTNGQVEITWYHGSTLIKANQTYEAMKSGVVDISMIPIARYTHQFPVTVGIGLPFMTDGPLHAAEIGLEMIKQIPEMQKEWSDIKFLYANSTDVNNMSLTEKQVKTFEDLKGLRLGACWANVLKIFKLLPCAAVQIPPEDIYMSLQRKTVDGVLFPNAALRAFKTTELTKSYTIGNFAVMPLGFAMSKKAYSKLPIESQKVIDELSPSLCRLFALVAYNEGIWVLDALKKRGDVFNYLSRKEIARWKKPLKPLYDEYVKRLNAKGYDGQAILDKLQRISDQTRKDSYRIDEWWKGGRMGKKKQ
jgi:TRAP-type C4-dicarboxylate transport system substrate-binding protein